MSKTVTVRLAKGLASWLKATARRRSAPQSHIVRDHLERARKGTPNQAFMELAGSTRGPMDLSGRKGFERRCQGASLIADAHRLRAKPKWRPSRTQ
jgi:hypothetical protein